MQRAQETRVEFGTACRIILNRQLTSGFLNEPARRHKRKRIQKKWLKRYGYKEVVVESDGWNVKESGEGMVTFEKEME